MCQKRDHRRCELCKEKARVYCEADEASLCWQCDAQVHGANFLVAKHQRTLLCHTCGAPTLWLKTGFRIDPKVPFCQHCFHETNCGSESNTNDVECRSVESRASSTMSYVSSRTLQQHGYAEENVKYLINVHEEDSRGRRSEDSSFSVSEGPILLLKEKSPAEITGQLKMCRMSVGNTQDEAEIAAIYNNLRQRLSSSNKKSDGKKIPAVLGRVLDGYDTEESSSSFNISSIMHGRRKRRLEARIC